MTKLPTELINNSAGVLEVFDIPFSDLDLSLSPIESAYTSKGERLYLEYKGGGSILIEFQLALNNRITGISKISEFDMQNPTLQLSKEDGQIVRLFNKYEIAIYYSDEATYADTYRHMHINHLIKHLLIGE